MTDYKQLCAELEEAYAWCIEAYMTATAEQDMLIQRARAALAEPEPEGPTDEELLDLSQQHDVSFTMSDGSVIYPMQHGADMREAVLGFARAVLARWGNNTSRSI